MWLDSNGKALARRSTNTGGSATQWQYTLTFDRNVDSAQSGPPAKLVWKLPLETQSKEIPFEFRNLPLP